MSLIKLSYNLLCISRITSEMHCKAIFLPKSVCFQDMSLEMMIDIVWHHSGGLYILDNDTSSSSLSRTSSLSSYFSTSKHDCMLWHFRLGHPNFTYICNICFPIFFLNLMSPLYLVMCVSGQNNTGFHYSDNHINLHNRLP